MCFYDTEKSWGINYNLIALDSQDFLKIPNSDASLFIRNLVYKWYIKIQKPLNWG